MHEAYLELLEMLMMALGESRQKFLPGEVEPGYMEAMPGWDGEVPDVPPLPATGGSYPAPPPLVTAGGGRANPQPVFWPGRQRDSADPPRVAATGEQQISREPLRRRSPRRSSRIQSRAQRP